MMARRPGRTEEQMLAALRQAESGTTVAEICRPVGISEQTFYVWKRKYAGLGLSELRELRQLREENIKLKRLVAHRSLAICCRRLSEKSSKASGPAGADPLGAYDLSAQ
ncbi:MAG: transposase [Nitrospira sp.]|nr:transposase [Nitrospira sp.]